jgi:hypothetical protein
MSAEFVCISDDAWAAIALHLPRGALSDGGVCLRQALDGLGRRLSRRPKSLTAEKKLLVRAIGKLRQAVKLVEMYDRSATLPFVRSIETGISQVEAELALLDAIKETPSDRLHFPILAHFEFWGGSLGEGNKQYVPAKTCSFFNAVIQALGRKSLVQRTIQDIVQRHRKARADHPFMLFAEAQSEQRPGFAFAEARSGF